MAKKETESLPKRAVLYTDGGSRPMPGVGGVGGWGVHGYIYDTSEPKQGSGCKKATPTAKGYMVGKEAKKKAVTVHHYIDGIGNILPKSTNNEAELVATTSALLYLLSCAASEPEFITEVTIYTDSRYVCDGITQWITNWVKNGWLKSDGSDVVNVGLWKSLHEAYEKAKSQFEVNIKWVKGHSGDLGNDLADAYATRAIYVGFKNQPLNNIELFDAKGYWNTKNDYNRMLSYSRWYFNSNAGGALKSECGRWVYHLGEHGKDDELLGKRMSDGRFSVVYLDEQVKPLEVIRGFQDKAIHRDLSSVVMGRLDNILSAKVQPDLERFGDLYLYADRLEDVYLAPDVPLTKNLRPARLAFNAIEALTMLQSILDEYIREGDKKGLIITDITDILYEAETSSKGKTTQKLLKHIDSGLKGLDVEVKYDVGSRRGEISIPLTMGIDIAKRNALSGLAAREPKVKVITWRESSMAFRYATVIEAGKDIGIWAGIYSNLRLLPSNPTG